MRSRPTRTSTHSRKTPKPPREYLSAATMPIRGRGAPSAAIRAVPAHLRSVPVDPAQRAGVAHGCRLLADGVAHDAAAAAALMDPIRARLKSLPQDILYAWPEFPAARLPLLPPGCDPAHRCAAGIPGSRLHLPGGRRPGRCGYRTSTSWLQEPGRARLPRTRRARRPVEAVPGVQRHAPQLRGRLPPLQAASTSCRNRFCTASPAATSARRRTFLSSGALACPKCTTRLRHIGADYDRPLENHTCNVCRPELHRCGR